MSRETFFLHFTFSPTTIFFFEVDIFTVLLDTNIVNSLLSRVRFSREAMIFPILAPLNPCSEVRVKMFSAKLAIIFSEMNS